MRDTDCWKLCRSKCSNDELADALCRLMDYRFFDSWESILKNIEDKSIKSENDIDEVFYKNW